MPNASPLPTPLTPFAPAKEKGYLEVPESNPVRQPWEQPADQPTNQTRPANQPKNNSRESTTKTTTTTKTRNQKSTMHPVTVPPISHMVFCDYGRKKIYDEEGTKKNKNKKRKRKRMKKKRLGGTRPSLRILNATCMPVASQGAVQTCSRRVSST